MLSFLRAPLTCMPVLALLLLAGLPPLAAATGQNDAGCGCDAPQTYGYALPVSVWTFQGALDPAGGDSEDWFQVPVPAGRLIEVTLTPHAADHDLRVLSTNHDFFDIGWTRGERIEERVIAQTSGTGLYVGVSHGGGGASGYTVTLSLSDLALPDLRITRFEVAPEGVPGQTARDVTVTVENVGTVAAVDAPFEVWTEQGQAARLLHASLLSLAPGESRTVTVAWDTLGQVGNVTLYARAFNLDAEPADNLAKTVAAVLVATPRGRDLLNHQTSFTFLGTHAFVNARYAQGRGTPYAGLGVPAASSWVDLTLTQGGTVVVWTQQDTPVGTVWGYAGMRPSGPLVNVCVLSVAQACVAP